MSRRRPPSLSYLILLIFLGVFFVLFIYSSLNLKNIDYGYRLQELLDREKKLVEEIDRLRAEKSKLLNLARIEKIVIEQLGYQYPQNGQILKVIADGQQN